MILGLKSSFLKYVETWVFSDIRSCLEPSLQYKFLGKARVICCNRTTWIYSPDTAWYTDVQKFFSSQVMDKKGAKPRCCLFRVRSLLRFLSWLWFSYKPATKTIFSLCFLDLHTKKKMFLGSILILLAEGAQPPANELTNAASRAIRKTLIKRCVTYVLINAMTLWAPL